MWTIGWKWYSIMNQESALAKVMTLEILLGAIQMKHIKMIVWRKQVNFLSYIWYNVACQLKDQGRWQSLP